MIDQNFDPLVFIVEYRMRAKSRSHYHRSSFPQQRKLGIFIGERLKVWNDGERTIMISKMRHFILSAILGRTIKSQKEMDAGEHSILIDMLEQENQIVLYTAQLIEAKPGTEPRLLFGWDDTSTNMSDLLTAIVPAFPGHARSPNNEGTCSKPENGVPKPYKLPF